MGDTLGKAIWSTFTYDDATHRLESVRVDREVSATYDSLATYTYDDIGNVTKIADAPEVGRRTCSASITTTCAG